MNRSKSIKDQEQDMRWNQLSQYDMLASLNIVQNHFCFNDYMERIISTVIISTFSFILSSWLSSLARGVWRGSGDGIHRREWDGFTWTASSSAPTSSGTAARWDLQHNLWEPENRLCLRVLREAGGNPPQTRHRPGEQHHPHSHTLHLCLRKIDDDNSGEHGRPWHRAAILPPCWGEKLHMVVDEDQSDSVKGGGGQWWGVSED